jgi:isopenicillin-N N-acyltransferase like protein
VIPEHRSTEMDPFDRGVEFGRSLRAAVHNTCLAYERLFEAMHGYTRADIDAIGRRVAAYLDAREPEAVAEIRGIAAGAEVPAERLVAINARTEIFAGKGPAECSVVGVSAERSGEGALLAQNWDWHPDAADSLVLWTVTDLSGRWFTTLTEAGILGKIGINSEGLAVCINILASSDDGGDVSGVPIHVMLRLLLQRCGNVQDAEALLRSTEYAASTAVTVAVAGRDGDVLQTFELSPRGVGVVADVDGLLTHTNHFRGEIGDAEDVGLRVWPDTTTRLAAVQSLEGADAPIDGDRVKAALRSHQAGSVSVCHHHAESLPYADRQQTLASVVMHLRERCIEIAPGAPCATGYSEIHPDGHPR